MINKSTAANSMVWEDSFGKYSLEIDFHNNLSSIENYFSDVNKYEIHQIDNIADQLLARELWNLQIPISVSDNREWGVLAHRAGWYWMTGDTFRFYQKADEDLPITVWSYYDLGFQKQKYDQLGVYYQNNISINDGAIVLKGNLFFIPAYREMQVTGQGRLTTDINDSKKIELDANYRKVSADNSGLGVSVSCQTYYTWDSGLKIALNLQNLVSCVFLSDARIENGMVETDEDVLGPVHFKGFKRDDACWLNLPLEVTSNISYPLFGGSLILDITSIGQIRDFSVGYQHPFNELSSVSIKANPIMNDITLGYSWLSGKFGFAFSPSCDWQFRGLTFSLCF